MTPEWAVVASILLCAAGAVLTAVVSRWQAVAGGIALAVAAVTAALVGFAVVTAVGRGPSLEPVAPLVIPWLGFSPRFHVDGLSSVFLGLAALLAVPSSLHSIGYLRARHPGQGTRFYYPCLLLFLSAMYGLTSTTDMMWFFFVFWQLMTVPGYFLIRYEGGKGPIRAANRYLWMMQIACVVTMVGARILVAAGGVARAAPDNPYDFGAVASALPGALSTYPLPSALAFLLFLVGFGIKMGMWPFGQVWLPDAHPAAPSPVSALLSGVMIKTGVYGLVRYFLWLVPPTAKEAFPLASWGAVVAVLGTVTLFTGTAQALQQERSKRLLAFHSIGQIGYVLLGAGAAMALLARGEPDLRPVAALALFGALFHVLNHGLFKALLFLDAGSMLCATGTQELDRMGGLMRHMPVTGVTALVASFAISGVPLLNGFASKWSLYVAALKGSAAAFYLAPCAVVALLTSTLTLASFVKFLGIGFLGRRSAAVAAAAKRGPLEVGLLMLVPQVFLAGLCLLLGLLPAAAARMGDAVLSQSPGGLGSALAGSGFFSGGAAAGLEVLGGAAVLRPLAVLLLLGVLFLVARAVAKAAQAPRRASPPWLCGYAQEADQDADHYRYSTHDLYGEVKGAFRFLGGAPPPVRSGHGEGH
ncbi:MAG TPA: proton-conducting transporter membrane subunit [Anaeromyxobacter sp.]|nr:proton-conducting transporter membrane subunit [Anaeromyxobacter sp.]